MNGKPFALNLEDLGGGLNEKAPTSLDENQWAILENWLSVGTSLQRRDGIERLTSTPHTEDIGAIARFAPPDETERLLIGSASGVSRLVNGAFMPLAVIDGRVYPSLIYPWYFRQYNSQMLACQRGNGGLKRIFGDSIMDAGIPAPITAPTIADGGAGVMPAGDYYLAVSFTNRYTADEGNLSLISNKLTLGASKQISATGIPTSTNPQLTGRRLHLTLPNAAGVFYPVQTIDNMVATTATINVLAPDGYGKVAHPNTYGMPPDQVWILELHKDRLIVTDGKSIFWSLLGMMQAFDGGLIPVSTDDGYKTDGLFSWAKHGLVVSKANGAWILIGDGPSDWSLDQLTPHGAPSGLSFGDCDGTLFWYTGENIVQSQGTGAEIVRTTDRVRATLDSIPDSKKADVVAAVMPGINRYLLSVPVSETGSTRKLLVLDYVSGAWETFPSSVPSFMSRAISTGNEEILYGTFADRHLYKLLTGDTDNGTPIVARARSKALGYGRQGGRRIVRFVSVLCQGIDENLTIRIYNDLQTTVAKERTKSLSRDGWKRFSVSTRGNPATLHQVEVEYTGTTKLQLDQLLVEGVEYPRRGKVR